jgi:16S rRNA C1402 (ribose-2'-O) methylase RsmI
MPEHAANKRKEKAKRKFENASRIALATEESWAFMAEDERNAVALAERHQIKKGIIAEDLRKTKDLKKLYKTEPRSRLSFKPMPKTGRMDIVEYGRWASMQTTEKINAEKKRLATMSTTLDLAAVAKAKAWYSA